VPAVLGPVQVLPEPELVQPGRAREPVQLEPELPERALAQPVLGQTAHRRSPSSRQKCRSDTGSGQQPRSQSKLLQSSRRCHLHHRRHY
jgi:hypothetical protein